MNGKAFYRAFWLLLFSLAPVFVPGFVVGATAQPQRSPAVDSDGAGAYATGHYRNLFAEQGHSQRAIDAKIAAAFQQLFHGDPETQTVYYAAGKNQRGPLAYVTDVANHDVRTEGMSYGMMITVELNHKAEFDALWNWAKTYMYIDDPKAPSYGFFAWSCQTDGTRNSQGAAPDGESYFAMALLFAAHRWPGGTGIYDYQAEAEKLLTAMVHRRVITGETPRGPHSVGPMMHPDPPMILFVPEVMPEPFTDPSYHLPAFYELWARWGPKQDRAFWARAAETSREFFGKTTNPVTGLAPDYANFDGTPHQNRFPQSGEFGYDAWRVASNWSVDWSWWGKAPQERVLSDRIQKFFEGQGIDSYGPVYTLAGQPLGATPGLTYEGHPTGLVATNAVASLAARDRQRSREFVEALWNAPVPSGHERYYDGMLYLMSLMHAGGRFHIVEPGKSPATSPGRAQGAKAASNTKQAASAQNGGFFVFPRALKTRIYDGGVPSLGPAKVEFYAVKRGHQIGMLDCSSPCKVIEA